MWPDLLNRIFMFILDRPRKEGCGGPLERGCGRIFTFLFWGIGAR